MAPSQMLGDTPPPFPIFLNAQRGLGLCPGYIYLGCLSFKRTLTGLTGLSIERLWYNDHVIMTVLRHVKRVGNIYIIQMISVKG